MQVGDIIAYKMSGKAHMGVIRGKKNSKFIILDDAGDKAKLKEDKVEFVLEEESKINSTEEIKERFFYYVKRSKEIEVEEIYEVMKDEESGMSLVNIADLYFSEEYNKDQLFLLLYALCNDTIYFKQKDNLYIPKKEKEVNERKKQIEEIKRAREKEIQDREKAMKFLKEYFEFYYSNIEHTRPYDTQTNEEEQKQKQTNEEEQKQIQMKNESMTFPPELPDVVKALINPVRNLAIYGPKHRNNERAMSFLTEVKEKTEFTMSCSKRESAFKFMYEIGLFEEDENLSILKYNIPTEFSEETISTAESIVEFSIDNSQESFRKDLSKQFVFTIDDEETTDIDDGLSIEKTETGYSVYVHIADVSHYIERDSTLDKEAISRSKTVYLPLGKIAMFPERLSENLMSLVQGKERPTLTFKADFDENFNHVEDSDEIIISSIIVKHRLSFLQAEGLILDSGEEPDEYEEEPDEYEEEPDEYEEEPDEYEEEPDEYEEEPDEYEEENKESTKNTDDDLFYSANDRLKLHEDLNLLLNIAEKLRQKRIENGAIEFNKPDIKVSVDDSKNITIQRIEPTLKGNLLVKEMMIMANHIASSFCIKNNIPSIFISQPEPTRDLDIVNREKLTRKELAQISKSLQKSEMGTVPAKHFCLGISSYTQATSPIRRYNDLIVHRQIKSHIIKNKNKVKGKPNNLEYDLEDIQLVAATSGNTARETTSIERETKRYWILKYLKELVGEVTEAVVVTKLNARYRVMLENTLTSAILVTNEDIEDGVMVNVIIDSVDIRQDTVTVKIAYDQNPC